MTDSFSHSVELVAKSLREREAFVLLAHPFAVEFAFIDRKAFDSLVEKEKISLPEFNRHLRRSSELLRAILTETEDHSIKEIAEKNEESQEQIRRELGFVREYLYT